MKGAVPSSTPSLYAKVSIVTKRYSCEKEFNFSVKSKALRREQLLSYTE